MRYPLAFEPIVPLLFLLTVLILPIILILIILILPIVSCLL